MWPTSRCVPLVLLLTWLAGGVGQAQGLPAQPDPAQTPPTGQPGIQARQSSTTDYISLYQKYLSGIRGQECPMYPSCSNFGLKAFSETNFVAAFVLTSDRLLRCGHDHRQYDLTLRSNGFKNLDYPAYQKPPADLAYTRNAYYFATSDTLRDDPALQFVKKLINQQYYPEALLEIMRLEASSPVFNAELFANKLICLKASGEYEKALFEYETRCPDVHKSDSEIAFQVALIQYKLQNFAQALEKNALALSTCRDPFREAKMISLNGLLHANQYAWQKSVDAYESLAAFDSYQALSVANARLSASGLQIRDKSPTLAGVLSIIPGAGYAYAGHRQTAISAFLVNGLLAYATYTSFRSKNYGVGILTGVFNLSFYAGNIFGAIKSARRYNEQRRKSIIAKLAFNSTF